jgi:hypothetical protein
MRSAPGKGPQGGLECGIFATDATDQEGDFRMRDGAEWGSEEQQPEEKTVEKIGWWSRQGSNLRPSHCERDALPTELRPHPIRTDSFKISR